MGQAAPPPEASPSPGFTSPSAQRLGHAGNLPASPGPRPLPGLGGLTFEEGADFPDGQGSQAGELAQRELEEEEGDATDGQHEEVGHEEGACAEEEGGWWGKVAGGSAPLKPSSSPAPLLMADTCDPMEHFTCGLGRPFTPDHGGLRGLVGFTLLCSPSPQAGLGSEQTLSE